MSPRSWIPGDLSPLPVEIAAALAGLDQAREELLVALLDHAQEQRKPIPIGANRAGELAALLDCHLAIRPVAGGWWIATAHHDQRGDVAVGQPALTPDQACHALVRGLESAVECAVAELRARGDREHARCLQRVLEAV